MTKLATPPVNQNLTWFSDPESNHAVHFYPFDKSLMLSLTEYIRTGLEKGDTCIVIAAPGHIAGLNSTLRANKIDVSEVIKSGQYLMFDADDSLADFMDGQLPNYDRFLKSIGRMISLAAGRGKPIRAFGEMVTLLWQQGNLEGVVKLEEYWHELIKDYVFSLYCAYPNNLFDRSTKHSEAIDRICNCHALAVGSSI